MARSKKTHRAGSATPASAPNSSVEMAAKGGSSAVSRTGPRVAVIVVTFNSKEHLLDLACSLRAQTHRNWKLIVVDSASTDATRGWLIAHVPEAQIIESQRNLGYRKGNRLGMERATAGDRAPDYLLILNDDVELHPRALERMLAAAEVAPEVAIVAPAILLHGHAGLINAAGSALLPAGFYSARGKNRDYEDFRLPGEIAAASGCCFLYRCKDYRQLGGFDAIFDTLPGGWHASAEDLDLSWRAWIAGKRVVYQPDAILWHKYRQRPMHASRFASLVAGRLAFLALNFRVREILCLLPVLVLTEAALAAYSALRGVSFLRAWVSGFRWLWGNRRRLGEIRGTRATRRCKGDHAVTHLMQPTIPLAPSVESNPLLRAAALVWFGANACSFAALRLLEIPRRRSGWKLFKPVLDRIAAGVALFLLSPLLAVVAGVVAWKIGTPVLFRQTRIGWKERPFVLYKFRTMRDGFDSGGRVLPDEERLTPLGRWLRSWSVDELPQLWNVLKGEMSWIGPRPLLPAYLPRYSARQRRRHEVRPGLSGWAQVCGRNAIDWESRFALDLEYVERQGFRFDLRILRLTVRKLLTREGISHAGHATMEEFRGAASHG
ncbi:MAG: sugar transferase [Bryobacterales bacterium]|nr:sugar transferase [Bryobacterales bacterium]